MVWGAVAVFVTLIAALGWHFFRLSRQGDVDASDASQAKITETQQKAASDYAKLITVAKSSGADAGSIQEALARAGPGTVIRVTDSGKYTEALQIFGQRRLHGIRLEADPGLDRGP